MAVATEARLPTSELAVSTAQDGAWEILTVRGELDIATAPRLQERLDLILAASTRPSIALEVSGLGFCDSSGLGLLVRLWKQVQQAGGQMLLIRPPGHLTTLLNRTGLDRLFPCSDAPPEPIRPSDADRRDEEHI